MRVRFLRDVSPYQAGETYDLPRRRALQLIWQHFAEEDTSLEVPEHKGGGWYELPGGRTVRGKDKAKREIENGH